MAEQRKTNEGQSPSILVAVADPYERNYASMLLQRFGYHVYSVGSAKDAIKFMSRALPQLVIAEERLAREQDRDLLESMKQEPRTEAIPAILLTTADKKEAAKKFGDAGYAALLGMPLNAEALYRTVQKAIEPYPRGFIRVSASVDVGIGKRSAGLTRQSIVLSENGMFVRTTKTQPAGARVTVSMVINDRAITTEAVVLYSHGFEDYPQKELGMGLRFEKISDKDKAVIRSFIREEIERGLSKREEG